MYENIVRSMYKYRPLPFDLKKIKFKLYLFITDYETGIYKLY